ncbi:hypothetical protein SAMN05421810_11312 [Amycolatopsis arida]|uniref:Uncharacterized protein n=1 Tax=Amycolatopsis arida TaxID=587909 RepID=A0A1I6AJP5_9PSEU|nr:hypothetical protein [Amycolatopsis arida]TDX87329.1 hypothetical protein CLV69_11312 [Amycolatopsis arida]SFQ68929.1 hypothetical protein SAMN05421810_11312 [Amycolatopsis arida]
MNANTILVVVGLAGVYLLTVAMWPYRACGGCQGGKVRSPSGRHWRPCRRCGGTGRRRRWGAHLIGRR